MLRMMRVARSALTQLGSLTVLFGFWQSAETTDAPITQCPGPKPPIPRDDLAQLTELATENSIMRLAPDSALRST